MQETGEGHNLGRDETENCGALPPRPVVERIVGIVRWSAVRRAVCLVGLCVTDRLHLAPPVPFSFQN